MAWTPLVPGHWSGSLERIWLSPWVPSRYHRLQLHQQTVPGAGPALLSLPPALHPWAPHSCPFPHSGSPARSSTQAEVGRGPPTVQLRCKQLPSTLGFLRVPAPPSVAADLSACSVSALERVSCFSPLAANPRLHQRRLLGSIGSMPSP